MLPTIGKPSFRLSYGPTRDLSLLKTLIGCGIILIGLAAALVANLFAEGRTDVNSSLFFLPGAGPGVYGSFDFKPIGKLTCGRTNVYAGQTFDTGSTNATFQYAAKNSFSYGGEQLSGCRMDNTVNPTIAVHPPMINPTIDITNAIMICDTSASGGGARFIPLDKALDLSNIPFGNPDGGFRASLNITATANPINVTFYYTNGTIVTLPHGDYRAFEIMAFMNSLVGAMQQDFELIDGEAGPMTSLPDILYPCWETKKFWRPAGYILWFCIAPLFTFFVPLYMAAVYALKSGEETRSINNALNGGPRRNSALARVMADGNGPNTRVDHIPMSPTTATPPYQQDVENAEHDPDYKAPLPPF